MTSFPFLYLLLVPLSLLVVAFVTERLEVRAVIEPVGADGPRNLVVYAGGGLDDALRLAHLTKWMR